MISSENCNQVVVAFTQPNPSHAHFMGVMVGYYDCPTALIVDSKDGRSSAWAAHLCRPATTEEAQEFWRDRALKAEAELSARIAAAGEVA